MVRTNRITLQKSIIVVGIILAVLGFSQHFVVPSTTRSGSPVLIEASDHIAHHLHLELGEVEYTFRVYVRFFGFQNLSAYLLTGIEYERFSSGTPLNQVTFIAEFLNSVDSQWESVLIEDLDIFIVLFNNNTYDVICGYYYAIIPTTFFITLTIGFAGCVLILCGLVWYMTGWRKYFLLGFSFNLILFFIRIFTLVNYRLGFPDLFGIPYVFDWFIEPFNDYQFFYLRWIPSLWEGEWPYTLDSSNPMAGYIYPPLWLYTVGLLGSIPSWLPGLILFVFNMATGVVVYHISRELTNDEKKSVIAMMLYLLNPLAFFYGSFLWLNPSPYVFFLTVSFWLALKNKAELSVVALAIATLYKQFGVIFLPLLILVLIKKIEHVDFRKYIIYFIKYGIIFALVIGFASLPFLLVDYIAYVNRVLFWSYSPEYLTELILQPSWPMNFNMFFVWLGMPYVITLGIGYLIAYYILLGVPVVLIYIVYARFKPNEKEVPLEQKERIKGIFTEVFFWSIIIVLLLQLFYPRGTYKFYLTALAPFISLLFDYNNLKLSQKESFVFQRYHMFPLVISWVVFLCFRLVYFWILLALIFFYLKRGGYFTNIRKWLHNTRKHGKTSFVE